MDHLPQRFFKQYGATSRSSIYCDANECARRGLFICPVTVPICAKPCSHRCLAGPRTLTHQPHISGLNSRSTWGLDNELLRIRYSIDFDNSRIDWQDNNRTYHPIITEPYDFSHLIHPGFKPGPQYTQFQFYSFDDVKALTRTPESKGESWEKMMACIPRVQEMWVEAEWRVNDDTDTGEYTRSFIQDTIVKPNGVSVQDVVEVLRRAIKNTELELRTYCGEMDVITRYRKK